MTQPRINRQMALSVERGLYMQRSAGTGRAAAYLAAYGVPVDVALRVLTTAQRRDMRAMLAAPPSWHEIISAAGPTYGEPTNFRATG